MKGSTKSRFLHSSHRRSHLQDQQGHCRVTTWFYNPGLSSSHYSLAERPPELKNCPHRFFLLPRLWPICVQIFWRSSQGMLEIALHSQQCRSSMSIQQVAFTRSISEQSRGYGRSFKHFFRALDGEMLSLQTNNLLLLLLQKCPRFTTVIVEMHRL
jgi:hypothetical protein